VAGAPGVGWMSGLNEANEGDIFPTLPTLLPQL